jgi:alpha-mannosidase
VTVTVNEKTGAIASLKFKECKIDLAKSDAGVQLNDYFYVHGRDPKDPQRSGPVRITAEDKGPLTASLLIESQAPGTHRLTRELRITAGVNRLDITDTIDKTKVYDQEAVHIAFPFHVPRGVIRMDTPWAIVRPEVDQLAGACKNYFTVQRWVDISNDELGLTWATPDAPLIEIGKITNDPRVVGWIQKTEPSTTVYSYVMNNYWETNYKAAQEGPTVFRYSIQPHHGYDAARATRFGTECSQPLIAVPCVEKDCKRDSLVRIEPAEIVATVLKPSRDGAALILRLFNPTEQKHEVTLEWSQPAPKDVFVSNFAEDSLSVLKDRTEMAPYEILTVRAQFPETGK